MCMTKLDAAWADLQTALAAFKERPTDARRALVECRLRAYTAAAA